MSKSEEYKENGFIIVKNALGSTEVANFANDLKALIEHQLTANDIKLTPHQDPFHEGLITLDKENHKAIVEIYETLRNSDTLCKIVFSPNILGIAKELLDLQYGQSVYMNAHSCRIDPPNDDRFTYKWHQQSYYSIFGADEVQLWTPMIGRNTIAKGTLSVLTGSHSRELPHYLERNGAGHEQRFIPDTVVQLADNHFEVIFIELDPRDAIFFHPYLVHRSNANISDQVRYSLIASYANPFDPRFKITSQAERAEYHRNRCIQITPR